MLRINMDFFFRRVFVGFLSKYERKDIHPPYRSQGRSVMIIRDRSTTPFDLFMCCKYLLCRKLRLSVECACGLLFKRETSSWLFHLSTEETRVNLDRLNQAYRKYEL